MIQKKDKKLRRRKLTLTLIDKYQIHAKLGLQLYKHVHR